MSIPEETSIQASLAQSIFKISTPGPRREDLKRISTDSLTKTWPRSCKDTLTIFARTSSRSSRKGLYKIMQDSISLGSPQDLFTGTCTSSCKNRLGDFSEHQIFSEGRIQDHASCTTSCKELSRKPTPGSPQDLFIRTCRIIEGRLSTRISTRSSRKHLHEIIERPLMADFIRISIKSLYRDMQGHL